jgi:hypothetical protein
MRFGRTTPGYDSQEVSEGRRGGDSPLTQAPVTRQGIKCSGRGSRRGVVGLRRPRARRRLSRGSGSLERGGDSPKGASSPRARWRFARGCVNPSSELEIYPRGCLPLERGTNFVERRLAIERDGGSPEGFRGWWLDGPLRFFRP